ncbi:MAG: ABC transporter ATP-binding protein [Bacillota bacterium]
MAANDVLIEVNNLKKHFAVGSNQILKAVNGVTFTIHRGETLGVVGESGCGKTTLGRTVVRLYRPTSGKVKLAGLDVHNCKGFEQQQLFRRMQMIFQDPYASLNPRMTVGEIIGEPMDIHKLAAGKARQERIFELLRLVGLNPGHASRFPHEFSGGQRQRIGIARALAVEPEFIVCDEPISALDVSIQAQVINLLEELQECLDLTYLFIAHDLFMVKHISTRIAVMYLGRVVELAESDELYASPNHPYTQALLSAVPVADPALEKQRQRIVLTGEVPSPINPPPGCSFSTRCSRVQPICRESIPELRDMGDGHQVACHLV